MIRGILAFSSRVAFNVASKSSPNSFISKSLVNPQNANFTSLVPRTASSSLQYINNYTKSLFLKPQQTSFAPSRMLTKYSLKNGTRKTVSAVLRRFYRLHWGIWIRTIAGRHKKLWKKSGKRRNFLKNHVFCNGKQSMMLDKMVNKFWRKPKYYIDDPYAVYHKRENFLITQKKPWRPEGVDYE